MTRVFAKWWSVWRIWNRSKWNDFIPIRHTGDGVVGQDVWSSYSCCHYSPLINDVISQIRAERTEEWPVTLIRFMLISPMWDCGPHRDTQFSLLTFLWWWRVSLLNLIMLHLKALMIILRLWNTYLTTGYIMYLLNHLMRRRRGGETEMTFLSPVWCHLRGDGRMLVTDVWPTWGCLPLH